MISEENPEGRREIPPLRKPTPSLGAKEKKKRRLTAVGMTVLWLGNAVDVANAVACARRRMTMLWRVRRIF